LLTHSQSILEPSIWQACGSRASTLISRGGSHTVFLIHELSLGLSLPGTFLALALRQRACLLGQASRMPECTAEILSYELEPANLSIRAVWPSEREFRETCARFSYGSAPPKISSYQVWVCGLKGRF